MLPGIRALNVDGVTWHNSNNSIEEMLLETLLKKTVASAL